MIPTSLDILNTTAAAGVWSKEFQPGHIDGTWLRATGSTAGASTDAIVGNIRMYGDGPFGKGDIHNLPFWLLRRLNRLMGGPIETVDAAGGGGAFAYSAFLPQSLFGWPNSLWIPKGASVKMRVEANTAAVVSCAVEVSPVPYSGAPMNYLLQLAGDRFPTLGGLANNPLRVSNLVALGLCIASTTDPASIHLKSRRRNWDFVPISMRRFSSWMWDEETLTDVFALLPLFERELGQAIGDDYELVFSGGVGFIDYLTAQATMTPGMTDSSRAVIQAELSGGYSDAGVNVTGNPQPTPNLTVSNALKSGPVSGL